MVSEMQTLSENNEYLFVQDGARAHAAKLTLETMKDMKQI